MKSKDREALIKRIEKYYKEHIGKSLYFYPLAVLYHQQNKKEKAYQILLEGLQYYPRYVLALIKIAEILIEDGKYEAALAYLETASSIQKYNTKALKYLALSYEKLDRHEDALEIYKKILSIDPNDNKAKSKIIELAPMVKPDVDKLDSLIEEVSEEKTINKERQDVEIDLESSGIDTKQEDFKKDGDTVNIEEIPEVDLEGDDNADDGEEEASVTLARLYEKQGYIDDAVRVYKKILEKEPDNMEVLEALSRLEKKDEENS
jgi:tetratricopeptide (TPR) repeat protein